MNNVSKNLTTGSNESQIPSAYKIQDIKMSNHRGESYDIQNMVTSITLHESLYSNTVVCKLDVRDTNNIIEDFPIIGQEKIWITFSTRKINSSEERNINLQFYVTEYPTYGKAEERHIQAFTLTAISPHAFLSQFKKISRSVEGLTTDAIYTIIKKDLKNDNVLVEGEPSSSFKGVINIQSPLSAVEWLRKQSYDEQQSPFYVFETLSGEVHIASQNELVNRNSYYSYYDNRSYNFEPNTIEDYEQRKSRILSISSDLKLGKIFQAKSGAFASRNYYIDLANKSISNTDYSYNIEANISEKKQTFSEEFLIDEEVSMSESFDSFHEYSTNNSLSFGNTKNYNELKRDSGGRTRSYTENLESINHDISLFGDFELNPGKMINIFIPKAIDPSIQRDVLKNNKDEIFDEQMSGKYLITSCIHTFKGGEYFTNVRIKKDSLNYVQ